MVPLTRWSSAFSRHPLSLAMVTSVPLNVRVVSLPSLLLELVPIVAPLVGDAPALDEPIVTVSAG